MKPARRSVDLAQRLLPFQQAITLPAHSTYCVYTHTFQGTVFYIGKGRADRPFKQEGRNAQWHAFVRQIPAYEVAIVFWTDDAVLARKEEARLIRQYRPACNVGPGARPPRPAKVVGFIPPPWYPAFVVMDGWTMLEILALCDQTHLSYNAQVLALVLESLHGETPPAPLQYFQISPLCQRALDARKASAAAHSLPS